MLELLVLGGRSLPHAMMLMIPEAWEKHAAMDESRRAFYEYSSALLEPWDGPAAIAFTDGSLIGATLDRNGLRPARWLITEDDRVILASETGVIDVPADRIRKKGRLQPGRMFLVDTVEGRILEDEEVKRDITGRWPYRQWLKRNVFTFDELPAVPAPPRLEEHELRVTQRAFGWTDEDLQAAGASPWRSPATSPPGAWARTARWPSSATRPRASSATSTSSSPRSPTRPSIRIREALVMSLATATGPDGNTLEETPDQCHRLTLPGPVLTNGQLATARAEPARGDVPPQAAPRAVRPRRAATARSRWRWSGSASRRWPRWTRAAGC